MARKRKNENQYNPAQLLAGDMEDTEVVGNRLFKIRHVLGYGRRKANKFAELLGTTKDNWSNWERGYSKREVPAQLPVRFAVLICEHSKDNITLDYIYRGGFRGMDPGWITRLESVPDRPAFIARRARRGGRPSPS